MAAIIFESSNLEMGLGSRKKDRVLVCPNCKNGVFAGKNTIGLVCARCDDYYSAADSLPEDEAEYFDNNSIKLSPEYMTMRKEMEQKAHVWKDKQQKLAVAGMQRQHEPEGTRVENLPLPLSAYRNRYRN